MMMHGVTNFKFKSILCIGLYIKGTQIFYNYTHQKGDIKWVSHGGPTSIRRQHTKFSHHSNLAPRIGAPMLYTYYAT